MLVKSFQFFLILLITRIASVEAKDIFFDQEYGNSGNIALKIQTAIDKADDGDILIFESESYDLDGITNVLINKPITLKGEIAIESFDPDNVGASGIKTIFSNTASFAIRSNDVEFINIALEKKNLGNNVFDILIDARHTTYLAENPIIVEQLNYTGIIFSNVILNGGAYAIHTGNGIGVEMTNLSIINYRRTGYWANRHGRINSAPKTQMINSEIVPDAVIGFDDRAISLDAGNSEYPVIWDFSGTTFKNCLIQNSGIALSRIENVIIDNCTFNDNSGAVDLIHIEEFSNNIIVSNNVFNCNVEDINQKSRIVQLDRELQISSDIDFIDNTINGVYNFFISAYAPNNITIKGNNFIAAEAVNNNAIDLTFYEARDREPIPFELISKSIKIENNPGLNLDQNKGVKMNVSEEDTETRIEGVPEALQRINYINPAPAILPDGIYTIENKKDGKKLIASSEGLSTEDTTGVYTQWEITFNPPYTYHIKSVGTGDYLETHLGYTEFDIINDLPQNIFPFLYDSTASLPFWSIIKSGEDFEIFPGGNEKQSILSSDDSILRLIHAVGIDDNYVRFQIPIKDSAKWKIESVSEDEVNEAPIGKTIWLRTDRSNLEYVSAVESITNAPLRASSDEVGLSEQFKVEDAGSGKVHLRSLMNNKYVQVRYDNNSELEARSITKLGWETFTWESLGEGKVAFKTFDDKYVRAQLSLESKQLSAISDIGDRGWDVFRWGIVNDIEESTKSVNNIDSNLSVYPNPVKLSEKITIKGSQQGDTVRIYDVLGRLLFEQLVDIKSQISSDNFTKKGIYYLKIESKSIRIVVQ
ncbi:T9SS type A sorting domain-containing protein [Aquimarina latercula]|uniref:T9SS type A sorting domain-containing protein n=1 Tax=Aquimarina latercula TaxID=987 RepID=UPI0004151213|nr:T9SS type A sorting domain-containing protein [Aquimarina latercula]